MKEVPFTYLGKAHRGFLAMSREAFPHVYWYFLADPELVEELGDRIVFRQEKDRPLEPAEVYAHEHRGLIQSIKAAVEQCVGESTFV